MTTSCPHCGSRNLRFSHLRTPKERLSSLVGVRPLRCRSCRTRFSGRTWHWSDLRYARCPKCLRTDLGLWSQGHYRTSTYKALALLLGANPYRCEYCRYNFVSFRRRRERYGYKRDSQAEEVQAATAPVPADDTED